MKTNYTDTQLQAAIDEACNEVAQSAIGFLNTLDLDPQSKVWAEETPARLHLIEAALAALPEPEPPTVDGKTPAQVAWDAGNEVQKRKFPNEPVMSWQEGYELHEQLEAAASAVLAAFGKQSQPAEEANARAEKAEAELARIIESAHEAGWNGVENPKDLAQFIKALAEEVGNRQAALLAACTNADELKGKADRWYNQAKSENVKYLAAVEEIQRLKEACEQEVLSLSQLRPIAEAGEVVTINDGGPAFPITENGLQGYNGMSLRDWLAGQALEGMLSNPESISNKTSVAIHAYGFADAMLAAREVKP